MSDNVPQFGIAEYPSAPGTDTCMSCRQPAVGSYYRVNGALACARCKEQLEAQLPKDSHAAFVRGLMFGVGGAILGLIRAKQCAWVPAGTAADAISSPP